MANSEHIRWILEGVASWNARREQSDFWPDFDRANLPAVFQGSSYNSSSIYTGTRLDGISLRNAFLRNANLSGLGLANANFSNAQLQGASLASADLRAADFSFSNLAGAVLLGANLAGAYGAQVNFEGANLSGADLQDTKFSQASFVGANLVSSELGNANLSDSTLAGADYTWTEPWNAVLYRGKLDAKEQILDLPGAIEHVGQLVEFTRVIKEHYATDSPENEFLGEPILYFRGHELSSWELRPSVMRCPPEGEPDVRGKEGEMLRDLMSRRPEEFSRTTPALSQWVLAQHHGLKTRLLDVTRNPLVALYFACESGSSAANSGEEDGLFNVFVVPRHLVKSSESDSISIVANMAKLTLFEQNLLLGKSADLTEASKRRSLGLSNRFVDAQTRLYHYIGQEKPHFGERIEPHDLFRVFIVEPEQSFERIRAQSGAFLVSAFHDRFEPDKIIEWNRDIPVYDHFKFSVPVDLKTPILLELRLLDITRETLFPGLDEATLAVMRDHGE